MFTSRIQLLQRWALPVLLLAAAVGCVSLSSAQLRAADADEDTKPADETSRLLRDQVALAKKGYAAAIESLTQTRRVGNGLVWSGNPEQVYHWSVSWLKAERDLSAGKKDQVAALKGHLERMTELHKRVGELARDLVPRQAELEAERYRLEAEVWLAKAKKEEHLSRRLIQPKAKTISGPIGQAGFIEPYERTAMHAKLTAYVEKWNVDIGDRVKKGDLLARLFAPELVEECATKKAQVKLAEARVELAKQAVKGKQADVKAAEAHLAAARTAPKTSPPAREAADAALLAAEAELQAKQASEVQARLAVKVAEADREVAISEARKLEVLVGYLTMRAPYDGVIVERRVNTWDFVGPPQGDSRDRARAARLGRSDEPIYVIDRTDIVRAFIDIPEEDANSVSVGMKAEVRIPGYRDKPISATITRLSWALSPESRKMRAEIDLPNTSGQILPGMYAHARVHVKREHEVWTLPTDALEVKGNRTYVWAYRGGRAVRWEVRTGAGGDRWVEVIRRRLARSGGERPWTPIDGSEKVIAGDLSGLADGKEVKLSDSPSSP